MFIWLFSMQAIMFFLFIQFFPSIALMIPFAILSLIYSIFCFVEKKVRSKIVTAWGILSLVIACWWIYEFINMSKY